MIRAIEALETAKAVIATTATSRYTTVVDKAAEEIGVAEAVFAAEVSAKEALNERLAAAKQRLAKARADYDEAKDTLRSGLVDDDAVIQEVNLQATALLAKGM